MNIEYVGKDYNVSDSLKKITEKKSKKLKKYLGDEFDREIERSKYESLELAYLIDYAGLVMIEQLCDEINCEIAKEYKGKITARYSIGFDDTSIKDQQKFLDLISATKKIGVMTTKGDMMCPTKSVTAIVGIYD